MDFKDVSTEKNIIAARDEISHGQLFRNTLICSVDGGAIFLNDSMHGNKIGFADDNGYLELDKDFYEANEDFVDFFVRSWKERKQRIVTSYDEEDSSVETKYIDTDSKFSQSLSCRLFSEVSNIFLNAPKDHVIVGKVVDSWLAKITEENMIEHDIRPDLASAFATAVSKRALLQPSDSL